MTIRKTLGLALLLLAGAVQASPPKTITYSGFLLDGTGAPVGGTSLVTFRLYDAATAGNLVFTEAISVTPSPTDGFFSVTIGLASFLPDVVFDTPLWLAVKVGTEAEMTPRIALTSVPSSFSAITVDWSGIKNRPTSSCSGATPYVTGVDQNGLVTCGAAPAGGAGCASGQVLKWSGTAWTCQNDNDTTYTVTAGLPLTLSGTSFTMTAASATTAGYLSTADWNAFNSKLSTVSATAPLTGNGTSGAPLAIAAANGTTAGYLSAADWNAFSGKLGAVTASAPLSGSGTSGSPLVIAAANGSGVGGYLTTADYTTFHNKVSQVGVSTNGGLLVAGATTTPVLSLLTSCADGGVLRWNAGTSSWGCSVALATNALGATAPLSVTGTTAALNVSMLQAGASSSGWLSQADWNAFNGKLATVSVAAPLTGNGAGTPIAMGAASSLQPGYLTTTDYVTFAGKQARLQGACPAGSYLQSVDAAGVLTCAPDQNSGGTVTSVGTGAGLSGGPITGAGTISIATGGVTSAMLAGGAVGTAAIADGAVSFAKWAQNGCTSGQVAKWNGSAWACAADVSSGGTVTSVATGSGLTGGPITSTGTISIANGGVGFAHWAQNGCTSGQIPKWNGSAWACAADVDTNSGGTVTSVTAGAGLNGGTITGAGTLSLNTASANNWTATQYISVSTTSGSGYGISTTNTGATGAYPYGVSASASGGTNAYGTYASASGASSGNFGGLFSAGGASAVNYAVYGSASGTTTGTNYGVYGYARNGAVNYAGYFVGDTYTSGNQTVAGQLTVGWERISGAYAVINTYYSSCATYGSPCYYGTASVTCSTGKKLVGGGCYPTCYQALVNLNASYPSSDTTWTCSANSPTTSCVVYPYAICARIQ